MTGYSISAYDIESLRKGITAETDTIGRRVSDVRSSAVSRTDFGKGDGEDVGAKYVDVVHGPLAESLVAFQTAGEHLAELLTGTYRRYQQLDEEASLRFRADH